LFCAVIYEARDRRVELAIDSCSSNSYDLFKKVCSTSDRAIAPRETRKALASDSETQKF